MSFNDVCACATVKKVKLDSSDWSTWFGYIFSFKQKYSSIHLTIDKEE